MKIIKNLVMKKIKEIKKCFFKTDLKLFYQMKHFRKYYNFN